MDEGGAGGGGWARPAPTHCPPGQQTLQRGQQRSGCWLSAGQQKVVCFSQHLRRQPRGGSGGRVAEGGQQQWQKAAGRKG